MPRPPSDKRERLTAAAVRLAMTHGLGTITLAQVADEAGVPPGSVYYYFRTKDDLARAVIEAVARERADARTELEAESEPSARLTALIAIYASDAAELVKHGSPLGSLGAQARRLSTDLATSASASVDDDVAWIAGQFEQLGFAPEASRARALHLLTGLEGAAALAHALGDTEPLTREAAHLTRWIASTSG